MVPRGKSWGKNNSQLGAGRSGAEVSVASGGTPLEKESGSMTGLQSLELN